MERCDCGRTWEVDIGYGYWEARINRAEGDDNLLGEEEVAGGEAASFSNALSNKNR